MDKDFEIFADSQEIYKHRDLIYEDESYKIIAACFEVYNILGRGFSEVVYKDALMHELECRDIPFEREKKFLVKYKNILLERHYNCDFIVYDKIIIEIKAQDQVISANYQQILNYLAVSKCKLGLLINFGDSNLKFKRFVL